MNLKLLPVIAMCMMATGCNSGKESVRTSGIDLTNLDTTTAPGVDFYQYACGGWMEKNPLTAEYSRFGSFDLLRENNREQLKALIEELAGKNNPTGTVAQKIGELYNIAMDSVKLNNDGATPIQTDLEKIAAISSKAEMYPMIAEMRRIGLSPYFMLYVGADDMNSSMNMVQTYQSGLGMGERGYYLDEDDKTVEIRNKYKDHVVKMFRLAGFSEEASAKAMEAVMEIETRIATNSRSRVDLRNPHANYNKKSREQLRKDFPTFNWESYLDGYGLNGITEMNIGQPEMVKEVETIINTVPLEKQIAYLQWKLIDGAADYLSDDFYAQNFDFYGKTLSGKEEMQARWKRSVSQVDSSLGEAVGQMYTEKHFPAAAKERMINLVQNLQNALGERIQELEWMSDETKVRAMEKLATFHVKIGYPDKWRDYTALEIKDDSYWENIKRSSRFEYDHMLAKAGKPVDNTEWFMTPQTVNAYYNPTTNEICFPAGILQPPFFDMYADDAFNYGAIGVVIGHEMTHGFDDQGRQYDKDGNLKDWWTEEDGTNFEKRAQVMVDFFDNIEVAPEVNANGKFTLGENIADYGGLQVSYQAFKNATKEAPLEEKEGFTADQRFFLAYANLWAGNIREEEVLRLTRIDPHSLGKWRVNGALPHIASWYEAFGITENDPMYVPVENRVAIW